jgi:hypothetical protein
LRYFSVESAIQGLSYAGDTPVFLFSLREFIRLAEWEKVFRQHVSLFSHGNSGIDLAMYDASRQNGPRNKTG